MRDKASPTGNQGNSVEEGAERLRSSTECDPEGRQRGDVLRAMRDVWEPVAAHSLDHGSTGSRDEAEQSHGALVIRETTSRDRTPFFFFVHTGTEVCLQLKPDNALRTRLQPLDKCRDRKWNRENN